MSLTTQSLLIGMTTDYRGLQGDPVGSLTYTNGGRGFNAVTIASFTESQLFMGQASPIPQPAASIIGSAGGNRLVVYSDSIIQFTLKPLLFSNWSASDKVTVIGLAGNDYMGGATVATALYGGDGNDNLTGNSGADSLFGGTGNDLLSEVSGLADGGDGIDTFGGNLSVWLDSGVAIDIHDGGAGRQVGHGLALTGIERLNMLGTGQSDNIIAGDLRDVIDGGSGNDVLQGMGGSDYLKGGAGDDRISGGDGADLLSGGGGTDQMVGGAGADRFIFSSQLDSDPGAPDVISDFEQGLDRIDLLAIPGNVHFVGQASFALPVNAPTHEVRYEKQGANTLVQMGYFGPDGDLVTMEIRLVGTFDLTANDFIL